MNGSTDSRKDSDRPAGAQDAARGGMPKRWLLADAAIVVCGLALLAGFVAPPSKPGTALPDLTDLEPQERKRHFFAYLSPIVDAVNQQARAERERLQALEGKLDAGQRLSWAERRWLERTAERLEVPLEGEVPTRDELEMLIRRAGIVPESLVLIQAAKESGWGTSRFALEGNNLFGQRCYSEECGLSPRQRKDAEFQVAAFESVEDSVEGYVRNINTHPSYAEFRQLRQRMREAGDPLTGLRLAEGLSSYSERGDTYVEEIRSMIRQNGLE